MRKNAIIIGAGHAGVQCAFSLRRFDPQRNIILLDGDQNLPFERPQLSKAALVHGNTPSVVPIRKASVYKSQGIDLRLNAMVGSIDRTNMSVELLNGETIPYDDLVIATGTVAKRPSIEGLGLEGVGFLRNLEDNQWLRQRILPDSRIVIVGGGFIGLEVAAAAAKAKAKVLILEGAGRVLNRVTCDFVSRYFERLHAAEGVEIRLQTSVAEIRGVAGRVQAVVSSVGAIIPADTVLFAIGIVPEDSLAISAGLECDDGILVDSHCRTSDPKIYAIGDVTRHENLATGPRIRVECIQNAASQAEIAASNICQRSAEYNEVPWFWTEQFSVRMQSAGLTNVGDQIFVRGDPEIDRFSVLYINDGILRAIDTINSPADFIAAKRLITERKKIDLALATDAKRSLV